MVKIAPLLPGQVFAYVRRAGGKNERIIFDVTIKSAEMTQIGLMTVRCLLTP